jgi:hypothetical protein
MSQDNEAGQIQLTLRVSPELWELMKQGMLNHKSSSMNEFIRSCIRSFLDETGDIMGSRRHFNKRMGERIDKLEAMLYWNSLTSQMLIARGMFTVLDELTPEDSEQDPPSPDEQMAKALEASKRLLPKFLTEQAAIVNEIDNYRRKQVKAEK